jgi:polyvinyl alcohol dehydrogenase (cytochrome)
MALKHTFTSRTHLFGLSMGVMLGAVFAAAILRAAAPAADWPMFGQNLNNTAATTSDFGDVSKLKTKWVFTTGGDVSARASVVGGVVYFPDWSGKLWALNADTGAAVWSHQLSDYGLPANTVSRTSPAVSGGIVYLGTQAGAWLLAINAANGNLIWKTQVESPVNDPFAILTASPAVYGGLVYAGVASLEEGLAGFNPAYPCCKARGSVVAVNASTGAIAWKTYMTPAGYSGAGVWGSNSVIDGGRGLVYVGTGNNYSHPVDATYQACISGGGAPGSCDSPDNHVDSVVALNLSTGAIVWSTQLTTWSQPFVTDGTDDWNVGCLLPPGTNCPSNAGPDYDFASAPNLITYKDQGQTKTILGAGQKSGIYFALDPDTGAELWHTQVGPGSALGGMEWGSATDGKRIYVSIANLYGIPTPFGSAGSWAALDPNTGAILWQKADPNGSLALGPLTVSNDVVFAPSMAGDPSAPTMLALNANNGKTLWSFASGASVNAGATVVGDSVYWGSGYANLGIPGFTPNNKFYAFSKNGR